MMSARHTEHNIDAGCRALDHAACSSSSSSSIASEQLISCDCHHDSTCVVDDGASTASFCYSAKGQEEAADLLIYTDDAGRSSHMDIEEAAATAVPDQICLGEGNIGTLDQEADYDVRSLSSSCSETTTTRSMRTAEAAALGSSAAHDPLLQLGCNCSGGLSLAHRSCIKKWFTQPSLTRNVALADVIMVPMDNDQLPQAGGTPITQVAAAAAALAVGPNMSTMSISPSAAILPAAPAAAAAAPGRSTVSAAWVCCATAVSGVVLWMRNLLAVMALAVCCCRCYCNSSSSAAAAAATHRQY
ncbi:unnamed protein product [Sphagnum compactum]